MMNKYKHICSTHCMLGYEKQFPLILRKNYDVFFLFKHKLQTNTNWPTNPTQQKANKLHTKVCLVCKLVLKLSDIRLTIFIAAFFHF